MLFIDNWRISPILAKFVLSVEQVTRIKQIVDKPCFGGCYSKKQEIIKTYK